MSSENKGHVYHYSAAGGLVSGSAVVPLTIESVIIASANACRGFAVPSNEATFNSNSSIFRFNAALSSFSVANNFSSCSQRISASDLGLTAPLVCS